MDTFNYHAPTKIIFGKNTEKKVGQLVKKSAVRKRSYITAAAVRKNQVCWRAFLPL